MLSTANLKNITSITCATSLLLLHKELSIIQRHMEQPIVLSAVSAKPLTVDGSLVDTSTLTPTAEALIEAFETKEKPNGDPKITVNRFVSEIASWYERLRNAMDIRDDEIVLRAAIERILKRRLTLGATKGEQIAEPLVRELLWAKYFPDNSLSESTIQSVADIIDTYLVLKSRVIKQKQLPENIFIRQKTDSCFLHHGRYIYEEQA